MTTLGRLAETVGSTVVEVVSAPAGLDVEVGGVVIYDGSEPPDVRAGDLLMGVGIGPEDGAAGLIEVGGSAAAAAVALKKGALPERLEGSGDGVAILAVPDSAAWAQIVYLFQSILSHGRFAREEERLGGIPAGDLFVLADATAALVGAPVTIEDRMSRVLAFSADQQAADAQRTETVLGRRVPDRYLRRLEQLGVFEALARMEIVHVESFEEGMLCRLVAPIHAGGELLGSIWAAIKEEPTPEHERALSDAAKLAVLHLLHHRAGLDAERTVQADLLATILDGTAGARESAERLGLREGGFRVLALSARNGSDATAIPRLRDALSIHLARARNPATAAVLGGVVLAIMSCETRKGSDLHGRNLAKELTFASDAGGEAVPLIGIGGHADSLAEIPQSRKEAEEALRVLRTGKFPDNVASIDDVRVQVLLTRFADYAADEKEMYAAKVQPLIDADRKNGSAYIPTLRAYFEAFGEMKEAARRLHVHPNTLRYRLGRAEQLSGIRFDDHNERLALMLLLSVLLED